MRTPSKKTKKLKLVKPTESLLFEGIKDTFNHRQYAVLRNVANSTGWTDNDRYIDVVVMCCWPSRGLEITAFEIKTSRGDFTRELRDPTKAGSVSKYVDRFYVVAPDGILSSSDLPDDWGLYEWNHERYKLKHSKPASKLDPKPLDRAFVASLLRRLAKS